MAAATPISLLNCLFFTCPPHSSLGFLKTNTVLFVSTYSAKCLLEEGGREAREA